MATICVLIFQFTANSFCINLALSLYVVAFGLMSASLVMHAEEVFEADKMIKKQKLERTSAETNDNGTMVVEVPSELKGEEVEPVNLKAEKAWSVIGAIFFGVFTIFTFIVLILY